MAQFDGLEWDGTDTPDTASAADAASESGPIPHPDAQVGWSHPGSAGYRNAAEVHDHCMQLSPEVDASLTLQEEHLRREGISAETLAALTEEVNHLPGKNTFEFAQWRQTPEGRSYLTWEHTAKKVLLLSRQRDLLARTLAERMWRLSDDERPAVPPTPQADHAAINDLESRTSGNILLLVRGVLRGAVAGVLWWAGNGLRNPGAATTPGVLGHWLSWPLFVAAILVALFCLAPLIKGTRRLIARPDNLARLAEIRDQQLRAEDAHEAKLQEIAEWDVRAPSQIGVPRHEDPRWRHPEDDQLLDSIETTLRGSRTHLPPPEENPVLRVPVMRLDPGTDIGQGMQRLGLMA